MLLETCRYRFVDGKVKTRMFGMGLDDWDIEPGWYHSPKDAKAAAENPKITILSAEVTLEDAPEKPKKLDGRSKEARELKAQQDGNSSGSD
jgi:hypothetical protein